MQTVLNQSAPGAAPQGGAELRRFGRLALFAACYTYALIIFGGIVRITGSGLGCGDDWPLCNGQLIPPLSVPTLIEYTHRLLAAGIGLVILAVYGYAFLHRDDPGFRGKGGVMRLVGIGAALLVIQISLGAITVKLELPTAVTVIHFLTALLFLATLLVAAVRAGALGTPRSSDPDAMARGTRLAAGGALLAFIAVAFGALTANTPGAPQACQGFPLCNGVLFQATTAPQVHIQWAHRLLAFGLFFYVLGATWAAFRNRLPAAVTRAAAMSLGAVTLQIAVAAGLVLLHLPQLLRGLHLAVGAAVWFAMVVWLALAYRAQRPTLAI